MAAPAFYWSTDSATPDDGGVVVVPALDAGRAGWWKRLFAGEYSVKWFGAAGDGATDDGAAIQRCIGSAKAAIAIGPTPDFSGITIYFPHGVYLCSEQLNFDTTSVDNGSDFPSVTIRGDGGKSANNLRAASALVYAGTATSFLSARSTTGFSVRDIAVLYSSSSFTGILINFSSNGLADTTNPSVVNCTLGCDEKLYQSCSRLLSLDNAIESEISGIHLSFALTEIKRETVTRTRT